MHKKVIFLVEAASHCEAEEKVVDYMNDIIDEEDGVDWYEVGGRYSGDIFPDEKLRQFKAWVKVTNADKSDKELLQNQWNKLGLYGLNCFNEYYTIECSHEANNVVKLKYCLDKVKEYVKDTISENFFDCNVFNLSTFLTEDTPETITDNYWAVIIDYHY